jgi:hypothetical protein
VKKSAGSAASRATGGAGSFASTARVKAAHNSGQKNIPDIRNNLFIIPSREPGGRWWFFVMTVFL